MLSRACIDKKRKYKRTANSVFFSSSHFCWCNTNNLRVRQTYHMSLSFSQVCLFTNSDEINL